MSAFDRFKRQYKAGQYVFRDGDLGTEMYTLQSGTVDLVKDVQGREVVIATLEKGDFFGEMAVLESLPRSMSARAAADVEVIAINGMTFDKMIKSNIEIAVRMLRKFSTRLREADEENLRLRQETRDLEEARAAAPTAASVAPLAAPESAPAAAVAAAPVAPAAPAPAKKAPAPSPVPAAPAASAAPAAAKPVAAAKAGAKPVEPAPPPAAPRPAARPTAILVLRGSDRRLTVASDEITIGRADPVTGLRPDVDLSAEDLNRFISRRHAKILFKDGTYYLVEEVGVTNGTYLNGKRLQAGVYTPIRFGDELCFGKVFLMFEAEK